MTNKLMPLAAMVAGDGMWREVTVVAGCGGGGTVVVDVGAIVDRGGLRWLRFC